MVQVINREKTRHLEMLGPEKDVLTLRFESKRLLNRYNQAVSQGYKPEFPTYKPHITIAEGVPNIDSSILVPYQGVIILGGEIHKEITPGYVPETGEEENYPGSLYVSRPVLNGSEIREWFLMQSVPDVYAPHEFHVTIIFSKTPLDKDIRPNHEKLILK